MGLKTSEEQLRKLGYAVDRDNPTRAVPIAACDPLPDASWDLERDAADTAAAATASDSGDPSRAVPVAATEGPLPDESWDLGRLARYASSGLAEAARLGSESIRIGRRSTVQIYRSGRALSLARKKLKAQGRGRWDRWLTEHGLKRTTAWEAAELYERAGSEDALAKLTPCQAKQKFGVTSPPLVDPTSPRSRGRQDASGTPAGGDVEKTMRLRNRMTPGAEGGTAARIKILRRVMTPSSARRDQSEKCW